MLFLPALLFVFVLVSAVVSGADNYTCTFALPDGVVYNLSSLKSAASLSFRSEGRSFLLGLCGTGAEACPSGTAASLWDSEARTCSDTSDSPAATYLPDKSPRVGIRLSHPNGTLVVDLMCDPNAVSPVVQTVTNTAEGHTVILRTVETCRNLADADQDSELRIVAAVLGVVVTVVGMYLAYGIYISLNSGAGEERTVSLDSFSLAQNMAAGLFRLFSIIRRKLRRGTEAAEAVQENSTRQTV